MLSFPSACLRLVGCILAVDCLFSRCSVCSGNYLNDELTFYVCMVTETDTNDAKDVRKGLSSVESVLLSSLAEQGQNIFTLRDIMREADASYGYAKVIADRLRKKGWLIQISRGKYLIVPLEAGKRSEYTEHEFVIASHLVTPYYVGYWSALNYHGLTEQIPITVYVATTKRRKERKILDTRYQFITLIKRKFFGYNEEAIAHTQVNISDMEKTLCDCLDHPEYCGGISEASKALWNGKKRISWQKVVDYGVRMGNSAILRRLGFLLELLGVSLPSQVENKLTENLKKGYVKLDPLEPREGRYSTEWGLVVNVPQDRILDWRRGY